MNLSTANYSGAIAEKYIPALNAVTALTGLKILMLSHTIMEGFKPGTVSYRTNNPGNIGTDTISGNIRPYATLSLGVAAQANQMQRNLDGKSRLYKPTMTLAQYIGVYAPANHNNVNNYVNSVISTFKKQGFLINANTTFAEIANIEKKKFSNNSRRKFESQFVGWGNFGNNIRNLFTSKK